MRVNTTILPGVVRAYGDELVGTENVGALWTLTPSSFQRAKNGLVCKNYLGTWHVAAGLPVLESPRLELPTLAIPRGLRAGGHIVFQPHSNYARNPPPPWQSEALAAVRRAWPGTPVFAFGSPQRTRRGLDLDYSRLGSALDMLALVASAILVVGPRSASAHIAASYGVPAALWLPEDGENWHLDYPAWQCYRAPYSSGLKEWLHGFGLTLFPLW